MSEGELQPAEGVAVTASRGAAARVIVVTAVHLSAERGHLVRGIRDAGNTADIVLVPATSGHGVGELRSMFPGAKLLVSEFVDNEYGIDVVGPMRRTPESGVDGYFVAPDLAGVAQVNRDAALESRSASSQPAERCLAPTADEWSRAATWHPARRRLRRGPGHRRSAGRGESVSMVRSLAFPIPRLRCSSKNREGSHSAQKVTQFS